MKTDGGSLEYEVILKNGQLTAAANESERRIAGISKATVNTGSVVDKTFKNIGGAAAGLIGPLTAVAAAYKFKQIAAEALAFENAYGMAMAEVRTISVATQQDIEGISDAIVNLAANAPDDAIKLSKAFYQIVSAGYDGEAGLRLLEVSSKAATAGITDTMTAADGLTTVLNAWKISADNAGKVADVMFKTVERGKTTFGALASSIAQVAPLAAANNIAFEEIFAAIQTITKQGTPTAQAMTQIRASIIGLTNVLGDGWSKTMTFQEALQKVSEMAGGSQTELKKLIPEIEGISGILATTGQNAKGAADDLAETAKAAGAMEKAHGSMMLEADNKWSVVYNKWTRQIRGLGKALKEGSTFAADFLNVILTDKQADIIDPGAKKIIDDTSASLSGLVTKEEKQAAVIEKINELRKARIENLNPTVSGLEERQPGWLTRNVEAFNAGIGLGRAFTPGRTKQAELEHYNTQLEITKQAEEGLLKLYTEVSSAADNATGKKVDGAVEKVRTLKEMMEDLKGLQDQMGAGTVADDVDTLAKMETVKQEIRGYYDQIREARKVEPLEKMAPLSEKDALEGYQAITREQAKQEFQGKKILKNDEAGRKAAEKKNEAIEAQNATYLKQVKIVEGLQEAFSGTGEVLGALSFAVGELDQDAGEALGRMADLAYNASDLVAAIGSKDLLGAVTSGIGMLGSLFGLLKGEEESYTEKLNRTLSEINDALNLQAKLLAQLSGQDYFELAFIQSEKLRKSIVGSTAELNKLTLVSKEGVDLFKQDPRAGDWVEQNFAIDTTGWEVEDWVKAYSEGAEVIRKEGGEVAKELMSNIIGWKGELADLTEESLLERLGFTSEDVADTILSGVQDGLNLSENSLGEWSNNFGGLLKKALTQGILESLNTKYLADFMEHFNKSMEDGALSEQERADLEILYRDAVEGAKAQWEAVSPIFEKYDTSSGPSGISGQISRSITEDTASELVGLWNRTALDTREIRDYSREGLERLVGIEFNTANTVVELRRAVEELKDINSNTNPRGSGSRV